MKKKELGITEGEVKIDRKGGWIETADGRLICECTHCNYQSDANLVFIADAFNTANKCGLLPSELLEQRDELMRVLKKALSISDLWTYGELICAEHICEARALDKMKLEFQNTINQIEQ